MRSGLVSSGWSLSIDKLSANRSRNRAFNLPLLIPTIWAPGTQIRNTNYSNAFWPQLIEKYKIACSIFCRATISKLIFRQLLLVILFASIEKLGLGSAVDFSCYLLGINKRKLEATFWLASRSLPDFWTHFLPHVQGHCLACDPGGENHGIMGLVSCK